MFRIIVFTLLGVLCAPVLAASGDTAVMRARQAFDARSPTRLEQAAREVPDDHVLAPYVEYWRLMLASRTDDARVTGFLTRYPDSYMAEMVRADWLKTLGARADWATYRAEYPRLAKPDIAHQCYAYRADWAQGDRSHQREAVALWFTGRDRPNACAPLFAQLSNEGLIRQEDVWRRLRLALELGSPNVAKSVAAALPEAERLASALFDRVARDPEGALKATGVLDLDQRGGRELALYALDQVAKRSSTEAARALGSRASRFNADELSSAWARLATWAARRHEPVALTWFKRASAGSMADFQREWWARASLRAADWKAVQDAIDGMSEANRTQPVWRYWRARALQVTGQRLAANVLFVGLSREHHYYGQLAQEELGAVMQAPAINIKVGGNDITAISRHPGILRAQALYELGMRSSASLEWNWTVQTFTDPQLLAAAEIARRLEWYDRAIYTAERTRDLHDFELRFIAPYRELAQQAARENEIDEAWVFGLMRQESRFINVARSGVGASGLMQIMPATARWIATRLGVKKFDPSEMQDPASNIRFGSYYLKHIQTTLDGSPVLATAAYNAGPSRAQRWRDNQPMEAAVYIESIPFAETRDYVKKVMSNAMYYAVRFGQPSLLLKDRLGVVPARKIPVAAAASPDAALELEPSED